MRIPKLHHIINENPTWFTVENFSFKPHFLQKLCIDIQSWALEKTEKDSWEDLQALQLRRIQKLVKHAYSTIPFWKKIMDDAGVRPEGIQSLDDFQKIPPVSKKTIKMTPLEDRLAIAADSQRLFHITTSGSTGTPTLLVHDKLITERFTAIRDRAIRWIMGQPRKKEDIYVRVFPRYQPQTDPVVIGVPDFQDIENLKKRLSSICKDRECVITSHTAIMLRLAELVKKENIKLSIKCISVSGEEIQTPALTYLREVFKCPVTIRYTSTESGSGQIAHLCTHQNLHINPDQHYLEVIYDKEINKETAKNKEEICGKLLITELNNLAMPLIRYEIGDLATILPSSTCTCGSLFPVIRFIGRDVSKITLPNGETHFIWKILSPLAKTQKRPWIMQFQMIRRTYSDFEVFVVTTNTQTGVEFGELKKEMQKKLGEGTNITITVVPEIEKDVGEKLHSFISMIG